jgi:hypothetical protein
MKIIPTILMLFLSLQIFAQENSIIAKNNFEFIVKYAVQRPFYSVTSPVDIVSFSHANRYRSRIGIGCKYYIFKKWFIEYNLDFSQEGGGFKKQFTNTNYLKNGINIGYSTNQNKRLIFDIYTGFDLNLLLNSRFINKVTDESETVTNYHKRLVFTFPLLGMGFKTKIYKNIFLSAHTYAGMTNFRVSKEENTNVSQVVLPAFQISLSKFLK